MGVGKSSQLVTPGTAFAPLSAATSGTAGTATPTLTYSAPTVTGYLAYARGWLMRNELKTPQDALYAVKVANPTP